MKNAAKTMYIVGRIISIIEIVLMILLIIAGILLLVFKNDIADRAVKEAFDRLDTPGKVGQFGTGLIIAGSIFLIVDSIVFGLAIKAHASLNNNIKEEWPHILMIIIGIFGNLFYTLGGIFGLVSENRNE